MLSAVLYASATAKLTAAYEAENGPGSAAPIPWSAIIALIMSLLSGICPKPPTPAAARQAAVDNSGYLDYCVRQALIEEFGLGAWRRHNGPKVAAAVKKTIADADDQFLGEVLASA